jgi:hypothetical protein
MDEMMIEPAITFNWSDALKGARERFDIRRMDGREIIDICGMKWSDPEEFEYADVGFDASDVVKVFLHELNKEFPSLKSIDLPSDGLGYLYGMLCLRGCSWIDDDEDNGAPDAIAVSPDDNRDSQFSFELAVFERIILETGGTVERP